MFNKSFNFNMKPIISDSCKNGNRHAHSLVVISPHSFPSSEPELLARWQKSDFVFFTKDQKQLASHLRIGFAPKSTETRQKNQVRREAL